MTDDIITFKNLIRQLSKYDVRYIKIYDEKFWDKLCYYFYEAYDILDRKLPQLPLKSVTLYGIDIEFFIDNEEPTK